MKTKKISDIENLRQKAEEHLTKRAPKSVQKLLEYEALKLIHELKVHEIELVMQQDELLQANVQTEEVARKYMEYYNFSPMGQFTLRNDGEIIELNLQGSKLLNKYHKHSIGSQFGFFVFDEDKPIFNSFLEKVFTGKVYETCRISLSLDDNLTKPIILAGKISSDGTDCLIAAIETFPHNSRTIVSCGSMSKEE
jgi:hypothetical protein